MSPQERGDVKESWDRIKVTAPLALPFPNRLLLILQLRFESVRTPTPNRSKGIVLLRNLGYAICDRRRFLDECGRFTHNQVELRAHHAGRVASLDLRREGQSVRVSGMERTGFMIGSRNPTVFPLRLPRSTRQEATEIAKREGLSLNQFITLAVAEKIVRIEQGPMLRPRLEAEETSTEPPLPPAEPPSNS